MYYEQLKNNLFASVEYPNELKSLMSDIGIWREFCNLPDEVKNKFAFSNDQVDIDPGYKIRSRANGREDKEYYHYLPINSELINKNNLADEVINNRVLKEFFQFSDRLFHLTDVLIEKIAIDLSIEIPSISDIIKNSKNNRIIRFLHYIPQKSEEIMLADQHFDRSGFALHLYESHPGLELLNFEMKWIPAPMGNGKTIAFSGYQLEQLTSGELQKTWHRVRRVESLNENTRISAVLFVPFDGLVNYDQSIRSQDKVPSYNI